MPISILAPNPALAPLIHRLRDQATQGHDGGALEDLDDDDVDMLDTFQGARGGNQTRKSTKTIVTPGQLVTDDPQWMRYVDVLFCPTCSCFKGFSLIISEGDTAPQQTQVTTLSFLRQSQGLWPEPTSSLASQRSEVATLPRLATLLLVASCRWAQSDGPSILALPFSLASL